MGFKHRILSLKHDIFSNTFHILRMDRCTEFRYTARMLYLLCYKFRVTARCHGLIFSPLYLMISLLSEYTLEIRGSGFPLFLRFLFWGPFSLSSSFSICQGWGAARNFFTASSDSIFHPHLSLVFFFQSSCSPAFLTSLLTQSSQLSLGLPRLLLPSSHLS